MSAISEIHQRLLRSDLWPADEIDTMVATWKEQAAVTDEGEQLIAWLAEHGRLTAFQGEAILAGQNGPFRCGPYEVREHLLATASGNVFRAVHREFDQPVSLKIFPQTLSDDPLGLARIQREVRVAIQLDHPNVLRTFQVGRADKLIYLAFEDLTGESLQARLKREGRLPYPEACGLMSQAAAALEHLHQHEIVHRGVRPSALWITANEQLKLLEFTNARDSLGFLDETSSTGSSLHLELDLDDETIDTGEYLAPEQWLPLAANDPLGDIYSLGCTLYHCLTGRPPFSGEREQLAEQHRQTVPQLVNWLVNEIPQGLADAVANMLAKLPSERPQSAADADWLIRPFTDHGVAELKTPETSWNPEYLSWVQSMNPNSVWGDESSAEPAAEIPSQLSEFLDWVTDRAREDRAAEKATRLAERAARDAAASDANRAAKSATSGS